VKDKKSSRRRRASQGLAATQQIVEADQPQDHYIKVFHLRLVFCIEYQQMFDKHTTASMVRSW
jgi:hypothetical protein